MANTAVPPEIWSLQRIAGMNSVLANRIYCVLQKKQAVQAGVPCSVVYNAINQSELLTRAELESFHFDEEGPLHWKRLGAGEIATTTKLAIAACMCCSSDTHVILQPTVQVKSMADELNVPLLPVHIYVTPSNPVAI